MTTTSDPTPLLRSTIGFDHLFDLMDQSAHWTGDDPYPPYNIERVGDDQYRNSLALAGFGPDEVTITAEQNVLTVEGSKSQKTQTEYLQPFRRVFNLAEYVHVKGACGVKLALALLIWSVSAPPAWSQFPGLATGSIPTLAPLVREVTPAVVNISVQGKVREDNPLYKDPVFREFFDMPKQLEREVSASGSGVIVDAQRGYVLTANHVVGQISTAQIITKDGRKLSAKLVGRDAATDIAVLQIQNATGLKSIPLGNSDRLDVGDFVIAVGNPFGLGQTVTSGLVSALGRTGLGKQGYEDFIQTDASINPGNSGGALINLNGELIGINTAIISPGGGNVGIGFAVPVNMARAVMDQIVATGKVQRGRIGVTVQDLPDAMRAGGLHGALIGEVLPGSPAQQAGMRKGDVVTTIDNVPVRSASQLRNKVGLSPIGHVLQFSINRSGSTHTMAIAIGKSELEGVKAQSRRDR